jgi:hypothetical protein
MNEVNVWKYVGTIAVDNKYRNVSHLTEGYVGLD